MPKGRAAGPGLGTRAAPSPRRAKLAGAPLLLAGALRASSRRSPLHAAPPGALASLAGSRITIARLAGLLRLREQILVLLVVAGHLAIQEVVLRPELVDFLAQLRHRRLRLGEERLLRSLAGPLALQLGRAPAGLTLRARHRLEASLQLDERRLVALGLGRVAPLGGGPLFRRGPTSGLGLPRCPGRCRLAGGLLRPQLGRPALQGGELRPEPRELAPPRLQLDGGLLLHPLAVGGGLMRLARRRLDLLGALLQDLLRVRQLAPELGRLGSGGLERAEPVHLRLERLRLGAGGLGGLQLG